MERVFLVSDVSGLSWAHVGPQKFQTQKEKCWKFVFGHFEALVLSSNRTLQVDLESWAMFRP